MIFLIFSGLGYTKVSKIRLSRTWISRWVQKNIIVLLVYNSQYHQHNSQRGFDYDWKWLQDGDKVSIRYDIFVKICNGSTWHLRKQFISEIEPRFKCHNGWNSAYKRQLVVIITVNPGWDQNSSAMIKIAILVSLLPSSQRFEYFWHILSFNKTMMIVIIIIIIIIITRMIRTLLSRCVLLA